MTSFVRVVDRGSLAAAAEGTGFTPTMIGNHIRYLEARLGSRLLHRTTRRQSLTELGRTYYERCRAILRDVEDAEDQASQARAVPRGVLRVNAPVALGTGLLTALIARYLAEQSQVEVELSLDDRVADLLQDGAEVAFRVGDLPDSGLVARPLRPYRIVLCASPAYLARHGRPSSPAALGSHQCLDFTLSAVHGRWTFGDGTVLAPRGRLRANNGQALRQAALEGLGIVLVPELLVHDDIDNGLLVPVLAEYAPPPRSLHLLTFPDRRPMPKVVSFVQFMLAHLGPVDTSTGTSAESPLRAWPLRHHARQ